ncbi:MAG: hypothetical protein CM1200mP2_10060 [Planctomycetaceae bacterium]|nr:MAG: hypothetical protein CM1200mP2_10060 [Planctomycetaceae bacterium]
MGRRAEISRKTHETDIRLSLDLDGNGESEVRTGIGFFDHMLTLLARHGLFDLEVAADGDLEVDGHHTVEDVGICLGQALSEALGDKEGIGRYGGLGVADGGDAGDGGRGPFGSGVVRATRGLSDREKSVSSTPSWLRSSGRRWRPSADQPAPGVAPRRQFSSHRRGTVQGNGPSIASSRGHRPSPARRALFEGLPLIYASAIATGWIFRLVRISAWGRLNSLREGVGCCDSCSGSSRFDPVRPAQAGLESPISRSS